MRKKPDNKTSKPAKKPPVEPPPFRPFSKLAKRVLAKSAPRDPSQAKPLPEPEAPLHEADPTGFAAHARDVRPLRGSAKRIPKTASRLAEPPSATRAEAKKAPGDADERARARLHAIVAEAIRFEVTDDGTSLEGRRLDVDPRELRKLRTLRYAVDGKLDLHGLGVAEARSAVARFLGKRASEGDRAVMVVHGKGNHSPRGDAILRGEIGAWLSQGSASRYVLAFASVLDRSGESGSLFVLLTR